MKCECCIFFRSEYILQCWTKRELNLEKIIACNPRKISPMSLDVSNDERKIQNFRLHAVKGKRLTDKNH